MPASVNTPPVPDGYQQIIATFGDPAPFVTEDGRISPRWEYKILTTIQIPFPLPYYLGLPDKPWIMVRRLSCHRLLAAEVRGALEAIQDECLVGAIKNYAGCYAWRRQRNGTKRSTHAWGIALDFNSLEDPLGDTDIDMDQRLVDLMERRGWSWGGRWSRPDAMHFQFATGY